MPKGCSPTGRRTDGTKASVTLPGIVKLAAWPTPTATDAIKQGNVSPRPGAMGLSETAPLAGWTTPQATQGPNMGTNRGDGKHRARITPQSVEAMFPTPGPARLTATGRLLTGSSAAMESGGQLNPAHSRWLIGLPAVWCLCAPNAKRRSK